MPESISFDSFRVWQVVVPARPAHIAAPPSETPLYQGKIWPELPVHLIEARTADGLIAVGESPRGADRTQVEGTLRQLLGQDLRTFTPATFGLSPQERAALPGRYPAYTWESGRPLLYPLLESLWFDGVGKASGLPAHQLMGGAVRDRVLTGYWANRPSAEGLLALIQEADAAGFSHIKLKSSSDGNTAHALLAIADQVPSGFQVNIDPMGHWRSLRESAHLLHALSELPIPIQIEDPFPHECIDDWRRARDFQPLTIVFHARNESILRLGLREEMAGAYNLGGGSVASFLRMAHVTEFDHRDCWQGSSLELGVLQHLRLHAAACARNCLLASDLQSEFVREHTLVTPRMAYEDGHALLPTEPGLGVAIDHDALDPYRTDEFTIE